MVSFAHLLFFQMFYILQCNLVRQHLSNHCGCSLRHRAAPAAELSPRFCSVSELRLLLQPPRQCRIRPAQFLSSGIQR